MKNLDLRTLFDGMTRIRDNCQALLNDAKLLQQHGRIARAYSLAYFSCEEAGKFSILVGTAVQIASDVPVNWKSTQRRFRSHDSKASQFLGLANAIPIILEAVAAGKKTVSADELMLKATVGVIVGPALFAKRNASIYCDFEGASFTSPSDQITEDMVDRMIKSGELHIISMTGILGNSTEEAIANIKRSSSRERYEGIMSSAAEAAELAQDAISLLRK